MLIKKVSLAIALFVSAACGAAEVDNKTALAMQLLETTHVDKMIEGMKGQFQAIFEKEFASEQECAAAKPIAQEFAQKLSEQLSSTLGSDDFKADMGAIYAQTFSEDELRQIIAFYQSPLGKKMLVRMPELMQQSMQLSQRRMHDIQPQLQKLSQDYSPRIREAAETCAATSSVPATDKK